MLRYLVVLALVGCSPVAAQSLWPDLPSRSTLSALTTIGVLDDHFAHTPAITLALRGRGSLGDGLMLVGELPFAHVRLQNGLTARSVGNPYLGLAFAPESGATFELGARFSLWPPTSQDRAFAHGYGQFLDFDRREAWLIRTWSVRAMAHLGRIPERGGFVTARLGGVGVMVGGSGGDGELLLHYGARAGIVTHHWIGWVGIIGEGFLTEWEGSIGDRTTHQAELSVTTRGERWRMAFGLRRFVAEAFDSSIPVIVQLSLVRAI
jgi:hypothetical protein